jgi:hypothetical protein
MKRFLLLWVLLTVVLGATAVAISLVFFHHVDLRYEAFLELLLIPAFQVAILMWARNEWSPAGIATAARESCRHPLIFSLVLADLAILALAWALWDRPLVGIAAQPGLLPSWTAIKIAAAGVILAALAFSPLHSTNQRAWLGLTAALALALSLATWVSWLRLLPALLPGKLPTVLRWLAAYGTMYLLTMAAMLGTGSILSRRSRLAVFPLNAAAGFGFVVALVVAANIFLRPFIPEPWASVTRTCLSLAATGTLASTLLAFVKRAPRTTGDASNFSV